MKPGAQWLSIQFAALDTERKFRSAVELCVTLSLVMILLVLAVQTQHLYVARAQISEALALTSTVKADMIAHRAQTGHWPDAADARSLITQPGGRKTAGRYVDRLDQGADGSIVARFSNEYSTDVLRGSQLMIRPLVQPSRPGATLLWTCASRPAPGGFVPVGVDRSTVLMTWLPAACRDY